MDTAPLRRNNVKLLLAGRTVYTDWEKIVADDRSGDIKEYILRFEGGGENSPAFVGATKDTCLENLAAWVKREGVSISVI